MSNGCLLRQTSYVVRTFMLDIDTLQNVLTIGDRVTISAGVCGLTLFMPIRIILEILLCEPYKTFLKALLSRGGYGYNKN
jgi:hypothetical protein